MSTNTATPADGDTFFYVIGGEYEDMSFDRLITSTSTIEGPFVTEAEARQTWQRLNEKSGGDAATRFEIIQVAHKINRSTLMAITRVAA